MAMDIIHGQMGHPITASGLKIGSMGKAPTNGSMADSTKVIGKITICTDKVGTFGMTGESTKDTTRTTESMDMASLLGQTAISMTACGLTVSSMARVLIPYSMAQL